MFNPITRVNITLQLRGLTESVSGTDVLMLMTSSALTFPGIVNLTGARDRYIVRS